MMILQVQPIDQIGKRAISPIKKKQIVFRHGHIAITDYDLGDREDFEKYISSRKNWKWTMMGGFYHYEVRELRLPRGYSFQTLKQFFPKHEYEYVLDNNCMRWEEENIKLKFGPKNDIQKIVLANILGLHPYESKKKFSAHAVDMMPGDGKTYTSIAVGAALNVRSISFIPTRDIYDQWVAAVPKFTNLKPKHICLLDSTKKIEKLLHGYYSECKYFLFMEGSFNSFVNKHGPYKAERAIANARAYVRIIDETHKNMSQVMMIEALCNCKLNIYLTATFMRSDQREQMIMNTCFRDIPKIGLNFKSKAENHVNTIVLFYKWAPSQLAIKNFLTMQGGYLGINKNLYEREFIREAPHIFKDMVIKTMKAMQSRLHPKGKLLFLTASIEGIEFIETFIHEVFPKKTIGVYHSKIPKKKRKEAKKADIVIATTLGMGEGTDITDLQITNNVTTYSSKKDAKQNSGRSRKHDDFEVYYIEYVNVAYKKCINQYEKRKPMLKKCAKGQIISENFI